MVRILRSVVRVVRNSFIGLLALSGIGWLAGEAVSESGSGRAFESPVSQIWFAALDEEGRPVTELSSSQLDFLVEGEIRPILDLARQSGPWRVVILLDRTLLSGSGLRLGTTTLAGAADELTELGEVEIAILDDETLRTSLQPTRDITAVSEALTWTGFRELGRNQQALIRTEFLREVERRRAFEGPEDTSPVPPELVLVGDALRRAVESEVAVLDRHRELLLSWLAENGPQAPGLLLWVSGGFDVDPAPFYRQVLEAMDLQELEEELGELETRWSMEDLSRTVSAYGWTGVTYLPLASEEQRLAEFEANEDLEVDKGGELKKPGLNPMEDLTAPTPVIPMSEIFKFLRQKRQQQLDEEPLRVQLDPAAPLRELAKASGGVFLNDGLRLGPVLQGLKRERWRLTYGADPLSVHPLRQVELRVDAAAEISNELLFLAPRWTAAATPRVIAELRAHRVLDGELPSEKLSVSSAVRLSVEGARESELILQVGGTVEERPGERLRATIALARPGGEELRFHRRLSEVQHSLGENGERLYSLSIPLALGKNSRLGVVVEDLATREWGGSFASFVEPADAAVADADVLPAPRVVSLLDPQEPMVMGPTRFATAISDPTVASVEFFLDGRSAEVVGSSPFTGTLDLGKYPQTRRVEVIARDAAGAELGRDRLVVNEGSGGFRVRIVEPARRRIADSRTMTGPVPVEVSIRTSGDERVRRVEFFWNTDLLATRYAPPYRHSVVVPEEEPQGFIRVVGYLEDGQTQEDVVFLNSLGTSDRVDVDLVELFVVVTDRQGRPVRDLEQKTFRVLEEGQEQEIATFKDAAELPLTVGLAIDSSASMFVKLPEVRRAATLFANRLLTPRDRAFVVGFGDEPSLFQDTTGDSARLVEGLNRLAPEGHTGLWKATVYSLVQIQGAQGKKALIVYSDGADEDKDFSYRTCLNFARRLGVPIYIIISNNEIVRTGGQGLSVRPFLNRLERLARSVGGRVYYTRVGADLVKIYDEIAGELRHQYLIAYYPEEREGEEWRTVRVEVKGVGLEARTVAGYYR